MQKGRAHSGGFGIRGLDRAGWVDRAEPALLSLINNELAVPQIEVEARLWDTGLTGYPGAHGPVRFFPHILSEAANKLSWRGAIERTTHQTKGAATAELLTPTNTRLRTTAIATATRRKAMLYARFIRFSHTFGAAGELVVRSSLTEAMRAGGVYQPITTTPLFGEVGRVGQAQLSGALDSGAWVTTLDQATGLPQPALALLVEVKNRRMTLYPRHSEVHQLLSKAALVQRHHPDLSVVPLLVCRRGHDRLFWMAKDLGFLVHATRAQYMTLPKKTPELHVEQLRSELGLEDLKLIATDKPPRISNLFANTIPKQAAATAERWATVGSQLGDHFDQLRREDITDADRNHALAELHDSADQLLHQADVTETILVWALGEEVG